MTRQISVDHLAGKSERHFRIKTRRNPVSCLRETRDTAEPPANPGRFSQEFFQSLGLSPVVEMV